MSICLGMHLIACNPDVWDMVARLRGSNNPICIKFPNQTILGIVMKTKFFFYSFRSEQVALDIWLINTANKIFIYLAINSKTQLILAYTLCASCSPLDVA